MSTKIAVSLIAALTFIGCAADLPDEVNKTDAGSHTPALDLALVSDLAPLPDLTPTPDLAFICNGKWTPPVVQCPAGAKQGDACDDGVKGTPWDFCDQHGTCVGYQAASNLPPPCRDDSDCCGQGIVVICPGGDEADVPRARCDQYGLCEALITHCQAGTICTPEGCM